MELKSAKLCFKYGKKFNLLNKLLTFKKGQLPNKVSTISRPTNLKKGQYCLFGPEKAKPGNPGPFIPGAVGDGGGVGGGWPAPQLLVARVCEYFYVKKDCEERARKECACEEDSYWSGKQTAFLVQTKNEKHAKIGICYQIRIKIYKVKMSRIAIWPGGSDVQLDQLFSSQIKY